MTPICIVFCVINYPTNQIDMHEILLLFFSFRDRLKFEQSSLSRIQFQDQKISRETWSQMVIGQTAAGLQGH